MGSVSIPSLKNYFNLVEGFLSVWILGGLGDKEEEMVGCFGGFLGWERETNRWGTLTTKKVRGEKVCLERVLFWKESMKKCNKSSVLALSSHPLHNYLIVPIKFYIYIEILIRKHSLSMPIKFFLIELRFLSLIK